jgi:alanine racemase
MSIQAVVASIKSARKGEFVGYGDSYCLPHDAYIGVLTIGYGDGVPVLLSNKLEVLIGGCRVRQVGSICMDMLMVELPAAMVEHGTITLGAVATLLGSDDAGNEIGLDEWAQWLGTHRWQVLTLFKPRLQRITV